MADKVDRSKTKPPPPDNRQRRRWTRAKILDEIRSRYRAGLSLKSKQVPDSLTLAARRRFGTWEVALRMACLDYDDITGRRQWTCEKVIAEIRKLAADQTQLSSSWMKRRHGDLYRAAIRLFPSSWAKALKAAGFEPLDHKKRRGRWHRKQAEAWLQKRIDKGLSLRRCDAPRDLREFVIYGLKMNWTSFVESFGIPYPGFKPRRDWSKETVVNEIRRWVAEGHRSNHRTVSREYQILAVQAKKYYGSWDAARTAAGVPLDRGPAPKSVPPVVSDLRTATPPAPAVAPVPIAMPPITTRGRPTADTSASRGPGKEASPAGNRTLESQAFRSRQAVAGNAGGRRTAADVKPPTPRDPILAFLLRGGLDEEVS